MISTHKWRESDSLWVINDLIRAEDGDSTLIEVMRVFFSGDVKINREYEISTCEVQIHGQSDL